MTKILAYNSLIDNELQGPILKIGEFYDIFVSADKGKLFERVGRKTTGPKSRRYVGIWQPGAGACTELAIKIHSGPFIGIFIIQGYQGLKVPALLPGSQAYQLQHKSPAPA